MGCLFFDSPDATVFKNTSVEQPWTDKYCDLEGTNGVNFINYAVIGTPTMYILDSKEMIKTRVARVQELLDWKD